MVVVVGTPLIKKWNPTVQIPWIESKIKLKCLSSCNWNRNNLQLFEFLSSKLPNSQSMFSWRCWILIAYFSGMLMLGQVNNASGHWPTTEMWIPSWDWCCNSIPYFGAGSHQSSHGANTCSANCTRLLGTGRNKGNDISFLITMIGCEVSLRINLLPLFPAFVQLHNNKVVSIT